MFGVDDPRSEPRVLHELTLKKWWKTRRAILLFVLSTKTTKRDFYQSGVSEMEESIELTVQQGNL